MNETLRTALKQLRLSGLAQTLEVRLQEAAGHALTHLEFLELLLQDELAIRADRHINRRLRAAQFRELRTLEDFDFAFNPSIKRKQVYDVATCRFIREARSLLWLGPPGTGKSHLCQAIGYQAIKAGHTVLYRSIFDHGKKLSAQGQDRPGQAGQAGEGASHRMPGQRVIRGAPPQAPGFWRHGLRCPKGGKKKPRRC